MSKCETGERKQSIGFRQLSIFDLPPDSMHQKAPRYSWSYYGITKERYKQLTEYIQSGRYADIALQTAYTVNDMIAEYILRSIKENKSYEGIEYTDKFCRIPCGRTDFYGYRRYFYYIFDGKVKEIENGTTIP